MTVISEQQSAAPFQYSFLRRERAARFLVSNRNSAILRPAALKRAWPKRPVAIAQVSLVFRPQKIFQAGTENPGQIGGRSFVRVKAAEIDHLAVIGLEGRDHETIRRNQDGFGRCAPSVDFLEPVMAL